MPEYKPRLVNHKPDLRQPGFLRGLAQILMKRTGKGVFIFLHHANERLELRPAPGHVKRNPRFKILF